MNRRELAKSVIQRADEILHADTGTSALSEYLWQRYTTSYTIEQNRHGTYSATEVAQAKAEQQALHTLMSFATEAKALAGAEKNHEDFFFFLDE